MALQDGLHHVRSVSLPSRSHPLALRFEEELSNLKKWIASLPSASPTSFEMLCNGLEDLGKVYDSVENLLRMPGTQKAIASRKHEQWVAEELECSVRLLDVCNIARESMSLMAEHIHGLQSSLRTRRTGDPVVEARARGYASCRERTSKEIKACVRMLRQIGEGGDAGGVAMDNNGDLSLVLRALREVRMGAEAVLGGVLPVCSKPKSMRWRLGLKRCVGGRDEMGELDLAVDGLARKRGGKDLDAGEVEERLGVVGVGMEGVERGLEGVFRRVIQNRVAVLNIINQ